MSLLFRNPILKREIEHRMRDRRTYFIPTVYLSLLGLATVAVYLFQQQPYMLATGSNGYEIGRMIFVITVSLQMLLVVLLVPSLSGAAITAERDQGCLIPILVTPMRRASITVGKLIAPILYIFFLLFTSMPFAALSFGFGGTDLKLLASAYGCIASSALFFAAMGLLVSTLFKRTVPAVMLSYALTALILVGTLIGEGIRGFLSHSDDLLFLYLNPFFPLFALMDANPMNEHPYYWWITCLIQIALSMICLVLANSRIKRMRE